MFPPCRLRRKRRNNHTVVAECKMFSQEHYCSWKYDRVGVVVHWVMFKRYGLPTRTKWYKHTPERVLENVSKKILRDFFVQNNHKWQRNKPELNIVSPFHTHVKEKEQEKVERMQEFKRGKGRLWQFRKVA